MTAGLKTYVVKMKIPEGGNIIIGRTHFIKSVEDIYEAVVETNPAIKFGIAFNEASGKKLIRVEGNDEEMKKTAVENARAIGAGHIFVVVIKNGWPITIVPRLKNVTEILHIMVATANPCEVIVNETGLGRALTGVVDGGKPLGVEGEADKRERAEFLRKRGYKR